MSDFPDPRFVNTNGIRLAVYEQGPADGTESPAPPVILCHGFPEIAYSWRQQLPALAAAGFRAIAPDQRGYGRSEAPKALEAYGIGQLMGDLLGLLDDLGEEKAVFCGHDWGSFVVWALAARHPDRVAVAVGLNVPHMPRPAMDPLEIFRARFGEDMYVVRFQPPGEAEKILEKDLPRTFRYFLRRPRAGSPQKPNDGPFTMKNLDLLAPLENEGDDWPGELIPGEAELAVYVAAYEKSGFTGPLNWYRNWSRNWRLSEGLNETLAMPCLMIAADLDPVIPAELVEAMVPLCPDLERHLIRGCGHWTQQEKPAEVNAILIDWLGRRFS